MAPAIPRKNRSLTRLVHLLPILSIKWGFGVGIGIFVLVTTDWRSASLYFLTWGLINALWQQGLAKMLMNIGTNEPPGTWTDEPMIPDRMAKLVLLDLLISLSLPLLTGAFFSGYL